MSSGWDLEGPARRCAAKADTLRGPLHAEFACRFEWARRPQPSVDPRSGGIKKGSFKGISGLIQGNIGAHLRESKGSSGGIQELI